MKASEVLRRARKPWNAKRTGEAESWVLSPEEFRQMKRDLEGDWVEVDDRAIAAAEARGE